MGITALIALGIISLMAHLEKNAIIWMVAAAMATFTGFYWPDTFTDSPGLAFGICFLIYALICFSIAFKLMFSRPKEDE